MPGQKDKVSIQTNVFEQKQLLLCNIDKLFAEFKKTYPDVRIGQTSFFSMRPKQCITVSATGTHVCVCTYHQNVMLMATSSKTDKDYKEFIRMIVCDTGRKQCMMNECTDCPGKKLYTTT